LAIKIIIDSREQSPWVFTGHELIVDTLPTGDYSIQGLEDLICIERKELSDFISCCASGRDRFKRELKRMQAYKVRCVIIEGSMTDILTHNYRSKIKPQCILGSLASWQARYNIPFILAGNRKQAEQYALALINNYYSQLQQFIKCLNNA